MTLAARIGINVPEIALIDLESIRNLPKGLGDLSGRAYAIARFDRTPGGPVHIEDFAQVHGVYPEKKYGSGGAPGGTLLDLLLEGFQFSLKPPPKTIPPCSCPDPLPRR